MSSYRCDQCQSVFVNSSNLNRHKRASHSNHKLYQCDKCKALFTRSDHLKRHWDRHNNVLEKFLCDVKGCGRVFTDLKKLDTHKLFHMKKEEEDVSIIKGFTVLKSSQNGCPHFTCPFDGCKREYNSYSGIIKHINIHLDPQKIEEIRLRATKYKCEKCTKTFDKKVRLHHHLEKFHNQPSSNESEENSMIGTRLCFVCPHEGCRKIYTTKSNLKMHNNRVHIKTVFFKCDKCNSSFKWKRSLILHKCKGSDHLV